MTSVKFRAISFLFFFFFGAFGVTSLVLIPFAILVYEYISTFQLEVTRFWGTRLTWGTVLFYLIRYSALVGTIPVLAELLLTSADPNPSKAGMCEHFQAFSRLLSQILVAVCQKSTPYEPKPTPEAFSMLCFVTTVIYTLRSSVLTALDTIVGLQDNGCCQCREHSNMRVRQSLVQELPS
ncbi:hypothetical protein C8R45DRAFT_1076999 [Mycena sanguinolenta]|nr:hypothetical protein C8R45DRAFT_1076999 [Mycena sanguinolenta]